MEVSFISPSVDTYLLCKSGQYILFFDQRTGVAYQYYANDGSGVTVLCNPKSGFGVSTGAQGSLADIAASFIWDLNVVAHELGVRMVKEQCLYPFG